MALIDEVKAVCDDLAPHGWSELFLAHGLDIGVPAHNLAAALAAPLAVKRSIPGFDDFVLTTEPARGVEPGKPAFSLLYHALASPNVITDPAGQRLKKFPTLKQIETVENYIFAAAKASMASLKATVGNKPVGVVVFAYEYRGAADTCHRRHADLVFARTGVSRVGTAPPSYDGATRGFLPFDITDPFAFRVLPSRFAAFIAVRQKGDQANFCPMRFRAVGENLDPSEDIADAEREFWLPLHKLFPGDECLTDFQPLDVALAARHVNEKLARIHRTLGNTSGHPNAALKGPPFTFTEGIAELSTDPADCLGFLVPTPHPRLIEPAMLDGKPATFVVPRGSGTFSSSLEIPSREDGSQPAPEYVNVRHVVHADGSEVNLNNESLTTAQLIRRVENGGDRVRHFIDFTGDGSMDVAVPAKLSSAVGKRVLSAYSLVTAPDFFPSCDQRELTEWQRSPEVPDELRNRIWFAPPDTLSDQRLAPNLQLPWKPFANTDVTMTAIVSMFGATSPVQTLTRSSDPLRHSHLPDDSAGIFAPGWDVGRDRLGRINHLAGYSLGSPFPEDAKLCAALSTFWPAVAPDSTREMEPTTFNRGVFTVSPLTDEEIGQIGSRPWDGVAGPVVVKDGSQEFVEFNSFAHVDYVDNALARKFSVSVLGRIDAPEYKNRVLSAALAHLIVERVLGGARNQWIVLSFRRLNPGDPGQREAEDAAGAMLLGQTYRFELFRKSEPRDAPQTPRKRRVELRDHTIAYVDPLHRQVLLKAPAGMWESFGINV